MHLHCSARADLRHVGLIVNETEKQFGASLTLRKRGRRRARRTGHANPGVSPRKCCYVCSKNRFVHTHTRRTCDIEAGETSPNPPQLILAAQPTDLQPLRSRKLFRRSAESSEDPSGFVLSPPLAAGERKETGCSHNKKKQPKKRTTIK